MPLLKGIFHQQCFVDKGERITVGRSIVALRVVKEAICIFGACTDVPITKQLLQAVKWDHSEYAIFLEKECKQALVEEEERKKSEQAKEAQRAVEKAKNDLTEQLKEQEKLLESHLLEQDTARQLISEASKKLTETLQEQSPRNVQSTKVAQVMLSPGNEKLNTAAKQLADIKLKMETVCEKLCKQDGTVKDAVKASAATVSAPPAKRRKLH